MAKGKKSKNSPEKSKRTRANVARNKIRRIEKEIAKSSGEHKKMLQDRLAYWRKNG